MSQSKLSEFNAELLNLIQSYATEQQLLYTSKHLISRSLDLAEENKSFKEAFSALIARSFKDVSNNYT